MTKEFFLSESGISLKRMMELVYISVQGSKINRIGMTLTVEVSLENYIGKINSINPDILVLIDCVEMGIVSGNI